MLEALDGMLGGSPFVPLMGGPCVPFGPQGGKVVPFMVGYGAPALLELVDGMMNKGTAEAVAVNSVRVVRSCILIELVFQHVVVGV
jgi:hypothetical protein